MVKLRQDGRPHLVLEYLATRGPSTTVDICRYIGIRKRYYAAYDGVKLKQPYYPSWPALRFRLRGGTQYWQAAYGKLINYNRRTRKYSISRRGRRVLEEVGLNLMESREED